MPDCKDTLQKLKSNIAKVIVGKEQTVELLLVCLAAGGHALIEESSLRRTCFRVM